MRLARARHKRGARAAFPRRAANHRPTGTNCEGGRHIRHDRQRPNGGNDIPSARQEGTPRRKRPANREICPVARPEHATGEFIPVSTKNATERALGRSCSSCVDVSFFAGHPNEMPSTAGDAFPGSAAPPEQEAGSPFPTGSRSRIAKSAPTDSRG